MFRLLSVLVLACGMGSLVYAQERAPAAAPDKPNEKEAEAKPEAPKEDEAIKVDVLKPYRTVGNTWMQKSSSRSGDNEVVTFTKYEVLEVNETTAKYKIAYLDKEQKETYSAEQQISLKAREDNADNQKGTSEKVKTAAGEFDCLKLEIKSNGSTTTQWLCKTTGLTVKMTSKSDLSETTVELIEHKVK